MKEMVQPLSRPQLVKREKGLPLDRALLVQMHELMVEARVLEERLIRMYRQGQGFFWIGGPGEEAFNVPLGLLMKKGEGLDHDYLHAHYRQSATMLALGEEPIGALRQMRNTATDPYSAGRNFVGHFSKRRWNIVPGTSPVEVQYAIAPGTAIAQRRHGGDGITIVTGGDAGTAEGDFETCLNWSSRPGNQLPMLIVVANNQWGISTAACTIQGCKTIADRALPYNMRSKTIDGNDPVASYLELKDAIGYVRTERKPFLIEAMVSRLYGHSSASGANFIRDEPDCVKLYEQRLEENGVLSRAQMDEVHSHWSAQIAEAARKVRDEPQPTPESIWEHIFAENK